ncbi:MAG TPA: transglutaminase-like domain-containing protein [Tepidisphaeraceae bacterium]|jgi:regulator of sirC expression with transglutaminase-like and TPR domain|nr:transglutaminase-like domain-containing protein [Tepidisphaeraceae bacterium]
MTRPDLPQCCTPDAFKLLGRQVEAIKSTDALLYGAVAISMHHMEDANPQRVDRQLQYYVDAVRKRARSQQTQAVLAHLHDVLFDEAGFRGNTEDYYNPVNSYLPAVLATKRGLPITLSLVYKIVAERLGLRTWGVGLPGHFLVAVEEAPQRILLIDTFSGGRILTRDEAHGRLQELFGPEMEWSDEMLRPASHRHWLTRILQNLLHIFGTNNQYADVAAILEMEMLLWPNQGHLQRDLALVLARIGMSRPASMWLDAYLRNNPDDPQSTDLKQLLDVLSA